MSSYEPFDSHPNRTQRATCVIAAMSAEDISEIAVLGSRRDGGSAVEHEARVRRWLDVEPTIALVARAGDSVLGFGRATMRAAEPDAPAGWYLSGLVVAPEARRRGIGERLTVARLWMLAARGIDEVRCIVNARNLASIALHERLGFVLACRVERLSDVTFEGGEGGVYVRAGAPSSARPDACRSCGASPLPRA